MPIYEFHCGKCGEDSEILVRSSQRKVTKCPRCGSPKLTKKFSVFASSGGPSEAPACERGGGGCACAAGRPHRH